jgi:bacterioferritin (cytochrome b1)
VPRIPIPFSYKPVFLPGTTLKKIAVTEMRHAEAIAERVTFFDESGFQKALWELVVGMEVIVIVKASSSCH